jgi:glycosyltransferase involved in cell wall biosynthesis
MRILFLNTTGGFFGGVEQNIALAAEGLAARGHLCSFASFKRSGVGQERFDAFFSSVWDLATTSLSEVVAQTKPEVIYVHKLESIQQVLDASQGCRVVRMIHDHDLYCPRKHKYYFHNHRICTHKAGLVCYADLAFLERGPRGLRYASIGAKLKELRCNRKVDALIVGSAYMKQELLRNGFDDSSIHTIPPCVAPSDRPFQPLPLQCSVLYVGQLIRGKGVDTLIAAHALLAENTKTRVILHVIGAGNDRKRLEDLAKSSGIDDLVCFHGWVSHEELAQYYDSATLVAVPSRWPEPFGMVGVEAMLRERPVVACRVGGIPDWLVDGSTGFLVPPDDPRQFASKMEKLILDKDLAESLGKEGRRSALERFSFTRYIETLETLLMG